MLEINHEAIADYGQLIASIVTALIASLVYITTRRIAKVTHLRQLNEQWQQLNLLLINDKDAWIDFQKMFSNKEEINESEFRKQQLVPMMINIVEGYYRGMMSGDIEKDIADNYINHIALLLSRNKEYVIRYFDSAYKTDFGRYMRAKIMSVEEN